MKTIPLGQPSVGGALAQPQQKPSYPSIHIEHPAAPKIPDKGTATVKYHVGARSSTGVGKHKKHSAQVQIHSFAPMGGLRPPSDEEEMEKQLNASEEAGETPAQESAEEASEASSPPGM
jgi:hypothetical protein